MTSHKYLGDSKMFEYDRHYRECQQENKPFSHITMTTKQYILQFWS